MVRWADGHKVAQAVGCLPVVTERTTRKDVMDVKISSGSTVDTSSVASDGLRALDSPVRSVVDPTALVPTRSVASLGAVDDRPRLVIREGVSALRAIRLDQGCSGSALAGAVISLLVDRGAKRAVASGAGLGDVLRVIAWSARTVLVTATAGAVRPGQAPLSSERFPTFPALSGHSVAAADHRAEDCRSIRASDERLLASFTSHRHVGHTMNFSTEE
jgi:hypothetical protein